MTARASWKGFLKIDEMTCPVALYAAASTSERIAFHLINRATGNRVRREYVDSETENPVAPEDQIKGYEVGKGDYVVLEADDVAAAVPESDKSLSVTAFVDCADIDEVYFERPYFLGPADGHASERFNLMREGMRTRKVAAIAQAVLFRRLRAVLIRAHDAGFIATTLSFDWEVRSARQAFESVPALKIKGEMLQLAEHIIKTKRGEFDPTKFEDRYENALAEVVKAKLEGKPIAKREPQRTSKVSTSWRRCDRARKLPAGKPRPTLRGSRKRDAAPATPGERIEKRVEPWRCETTGPGETSRRPRSLAAARLRSRAPASSCRSTTRGACTTISGSSSTASLKSWAVPRGPSLVPGEKRLAVASRIIRSNTPISKARFPKGEYGGGAVSSGTAATWTPMGDARKGLRQGHLDFELHGEKLNGRWHLVSMRTKPREKHDNWLLIKGDDEFAAARRAPDISRSGRIRCSPGRAIGGSEAPRRRGRPTEGGKSANVNRGRRRSGDRTGRQGGARRRQLPPFVEPMLATLVKAARRANAGSRDQVRRISPAGAHRGRRRRPADPQRARLDEEFGEGLVEALRALPVQERADRRRVGRRERRRRVGFFGAAGRPRARVAATVSSTTPSISSISTVIDLRKAPLLRAQGIVGASSSAPRIDGAVRLSEHLEEERRPGVAHACRLGLEGVVSKLRDAPYRSGRGKSWIKSKCSQRQEFVIGGLPPRPPSRSAIGSLALGVYEAARCAMSAGSAPASARRSRATSFAGSSRCAAPSAVRGRSQADEARELALFAPSWSPKSIFAPGPADGLLRHACLSRLARGQAGSARSCGRRRRPGPSRSRSAAT